MEIAFFSYPLHSAFGMDKLEWCGYLTVKIKDIGLRLAVSIEYWGMTEDGQTDGHLANAIMQHNMP